AQVGAGEDVVKGCRGAGFIPADGVKDRHPGQGRPPLAGVKPAPQRSPTSPQAVGRTALFLSADRRPTAAAPGGQEQRCPPYGSACLAGAPVGLEKTLWSGGGGAGFIPADGVKDRHPGQGRHTAGRRKAGPTEVPIL